MFHPGSRGEIAFHQVKPYVCPACGFKTYIQPCVGCYARQAKAVGAAIEVAFKPVAEAAQAEGRKHGAAKGGKTAGRGRPIASRGSSPKGKQDESARTTAIACKAVAGRVQVSTRPAITHPERS